MKRPRKNGGRRERGLKGESPGPRLQVGVDTQVVDPELVTLK